MLLANSRTPGERAGDLDAQVGANVLGVRRLAESADEPIDEVIAYGERRMRAALAALPDGEWIAEDVSTPPARTPSSRCPRRSGCASRVVRRCPSRSTSPAPIRSPTATSTPSRRSPSPPSGFAIRSVVDPTIPANGGAMRPVRIHLPVGSIVAAEPPAAVGAGNVEVSQRVADVVLAALAALDPERVAAGNQGTMNNLLIGGRRLGVLRDRRRRAGRPDVGRDGPRPASRGSRPA